MDGRRRRQSRRPEARGWLRSGGEGRAGPEMLIPSRSSGGGGPSWPDRDGVRRRVAADMGRRCSACLRPGSEGKRRRRSWGSRCPPWLGLWRCGEGCPAMAGVRERLLWRVAALGGRGGGGWWHCGLWEQRSGAGVPFIGGGVELGRWRLGGMRAEVSSALCARPRRRGAYGETT